MAYQTVQLVIKNSFWDVVPEETLVRQRASSDGLVRYHACVAMSTWKKLDDDILSLAGSTEDGGSECCSCCESCGSITVQEVEGSVRHSRESSPTPRESSLEVQSAPAWQPEQNFRGGPVRVAGRIVAPNRSLRRPRAQDSEEKLQCQFLVGIEEESRFRVARRLLGPAGAHVKAIAAKTGARLRLRGRGSKFLEGPEKQESADPLMLCVSAPGREAYEEAVRQVIAILEGIYVDFQKFRSRNGRTPDLLMVELHEGPREGSC